MNGNPYDSVLQTVFRAEEAVVHAQANNNPQLFQHAHNALLQAQQAVNEVLRNDGSKSAEETHQLKRAQELLKHLFEAYDSIQIK